MIETFLSLSDQVGLFVAGALTTILILGLTVRVLWKQTVQQWERLVTSLKEQFDQRLSDKNAELSQVWSELRAERDEKRRAQANSEGFESLLRREQELTKAALEEAQSWRELFKQKEGGR